MSEDKSVKTSSEVLDEIAAFLDENQRVWGHRPQNEFRGCASKLEQVIKGDASEDEKNRAEKLFDFAQKCLLTAMIESHVHGLPQKSQMTASEAFQEGLRVLDIGNRLDPALLKSTSVLSKKGGYGVVYKGMYNGMPVAVKVLRPEFVTARDMELFIVEAQKLARLHHPRICEYIGYIPEPFQIVTRGYSRSLFSALEEWRCGRQVFTCEDMFRISFQVGSALQYLHESGVLHRDIKPENVFLDDDGDAKLGDFGLAQFVTGTVRDDGGPVGNELFMAPEVLLHDLFDARCEVYSFGLLIYEIFTGRYVFAGVRTKEELIEAQKTMKSVPVTSDDWSSHPGDGLPPKELWDLAKRCWSYNPKDRPVMSTVVKELTKIGVHAAIPNSSAAAEFWLICSGGEYRDKLLVDTLMEHIVKPADPISHHLFERLTPKTWTRFTITEFNCFNCWFPNFFICPTVVSAMSRLSRKMWFVPLDAKIEERFAKAKGDAFVIRPSVSNPLPYPFTLEICVKGKREKMRIERRVDKDNFPVFFCNTLIPHRPFNSLEEFADVLINEFHLNPLE